MLQPSGKHCSTSGVDVLCGRVALSHHILRHLRWRRLKFCQPRSTLAEPEGLQPKRKASAVISNFPPGFTLLLLHLPSNIQRWLKWRRRRRSFHANKLPAALNYSRTFSPSIDLLVSPLQKRSVLRLILQSSP